MKKFNVKKDQIMPPEPKESSLKTEKESEDDLEDAERLAVLNDKSRQNTTGTDNDLAIDIQDALARERSLSGAVDNIDVTVEGEIVTLKGEVNTEKEIMIAGDIATSLAGENNLNNHLSVKNRDNE